MAATSKTVTIKGENIEGVTREIEIPATGIKTTATNNINSFSLPNTNPTQTNFKETKALNINRIKTEIQLNKAKVTDEFAAKNHNGNGDRPNLDNKEGWITEAYKLFVSGKILDLKATNNDTFPITSQFSGYMHNLDWQEKSMEENSVYDVTIKIVEEVPLNS